MLGQQKTCKLYQVNLKGGYKEGIRREYKGNREKVCILTASPSFLVISL